MLSSRARIFLAEDEAAILRFVSNILSRMDDVCELVGTAQNGLDALEEIGRLQPEIVVTDIVMPMMDGLELMKRTSALCPNVKFIVLTGHERFDFAQRAIELQAVNYLLKPIDVEKLTRTIRESALALRREREGLIRRQLREIYLSEGRTSLGFQLDGLHLYLISAYLGNYTTLNEWRSDVADPVQIDFSRLLPEPSGAEGYAFDTVNGRERGFAVLSEQPCDEAMLQMAEALMAVAFADGGPVTVTVSERIDAVEQIQQAIAQMRKTLPLSQRFGRGGVLAAGTCASGIAAAPECVQRLYPGIGANQLKKWAREVIRDWAERDAPCHVIRSDLMCFLSAAQLYGQASTVQRSAQETVEALIACPDYDALEVHFTAEMMALMGLTSACDQRDPQEWALSQRIRQYLDATFRGDFDREKLGANFGYNKNYLTTLFSECFGMSPGQYVVKKRIELAKEIIDRAGDLKIKEISERVGYNDSLYFSRVFKVQTGYSPREYANRYRDPDL